MPITADNFATTMPTGTHFEPMSDPSAGLGGDQCCALTSALLGEVRTLAGEVAVESVLRIAGSDHSRAYLSRPTNWISSEEANALWEAAARVTHDRSLARTVGGMVARELYDAGRAEADAEPWTARHEALVQLARSADRYTPRTVSSVAQCRPGLVELVQRPVGGAQRSTHQCEATLGLLDQLAQLLGLPGATVEHGHCAALGASQCGYRIRWRAAPPRLRAYGPKDRQALQTDPFGNPQTAAGLRAELDAMRERLRGVFDTTADLVGSGRVGELLERIAERAASETGAERYLLVVRADDGHEPSVHGRGFGVEQVRALLGAAAPELDPSWLVAPIRSEEHEYGLLVVVPAPAARVRAEDRRLLEVYARYAAIALDGATARRRAEHRFRQTTALLEFAREVSAAGTSADVAQRLADSVGLVVDGDEVGVHLFDGDRFTLLGYRDYRGLRDQPPRIPRQWVPEPGDAAARFVADPQLAPMYLSPATAGATDREKLVEGHFEAAIMVPLAGADRLLGLLFIAVRDRPERLRRSAELTRLIEGVVAQATTTLENGRLMDVVIRQAHHDQLTGLANRVKFSAELHDALAQARAGGSLVGLFYLDLNGFKAVNDSFGHEIGDALLVAIAARLQTRLAESASAARLGGDEFAIIARARRLAELDRVDRAIADAFAEPFVLGETSLGLTVSVGRSVFPEDARDGHVLVRIADATMYANKDLQRALPGPARLSAAAIG